MGTNIWSEIKSKRIGGRSQADDSEDLCRSMDNPPRSEIRDTESISQDKLHAGLLKYVRIQKMYWQVDVSETREFQKAFNGFYRVRRNGEWQQHFYSILERIKTVEMDYPEVLREMHHKTGNIEASFASKLTATRYPDRPVIDRFVLENLGLALPKPNEQDRLVKTIAVYDQLVERYEAMLQDSERVKAIDELREKYDEARTITDLKALDLILWQTRGGESDH